jgi:hypothetical protein
MASAWQQGADSVVKKLNDKFKDKTAVVATSRDFQNKHGPKGHGGGVGQKPYKFGNFAGFNNTVVNPQDQAKWLIDTGTRNWDQSLALLEETIRNNLADTGPQVPMAFSVLPDGGNKARVDVTPITDPQTGNLISYDIKIHCRT